MAPAQKTQSPQSDPKRGDSWIPERPGDAITGKVIDVDQAWSDVSDSFYPLLRLAQVKIRDGADGQVTEPEREIAVHGLRSVLRNEILKRRPVPGETITVRYIGQSERDPRPGQSPAWIFRLTVEGRDPVEQARSIYDQMGGPRKGQSADPVRVAAGGQDDDAPF